MSKRTYNIYFHLHTVSGIVITVGLFVIFFAGAFTLFMKEIEEWEHSNEKLAPAHSGIASKPLDLDRLLRVLEKKGYDLYGRNMYIDLLAPGATQPLYLSESEDSLAKGEAQEYKNLILNRATYEISERSKSASVTLSELLYELHFFYQLGGDPGYYLSGLVSLFFLFAMVSGIIVHWKKIVSNFYLFRPFEKLKTVWTDAHTALGIIGIPFQFMYALTGAWFGLGVLVASTGALLYKGDQSKYYDEVYGHHEHKLGPRVAWNGQKLNAYRDSAAFKWPGFRLTYISLSQVASSNMEMRVYGEVSSKFSFFNFGELEFDVASGKIKHMQDPYSKPYDEIVSASIHRLHFGYFGLEGWRHLAVKTLYFLLAVATCFVIITGVLIWLEARKKNNVPEKERRFNRQVGYIYLAICLSMLPVTALAFLVTKLLPNSLDEHRAIILNSVYFGGWLLASIFFALKRNNYFTNKYTLLTAGLLGLCIPLANGLVSGNWFWLTLSNNSRHIFVTDALWIMLSTFSLITVYAMKRKHVHS